MIHFSNVKSPSETTSSIKYLDEPGSTRPAARLNKIKMKPIERLFRRGQIISWKAHLRETVEGFLFSDNLVNNILNVCRDMTVLNRTLGPRFNYLDL